MNIANNTGNATITNLIGSTLFAESSNGTVTSAIGANVATEIDGGTTSNVIGVNINMWSGGGTMTRRYGIYMNPPTGTPTTADYGIYQEGTQPNSFAGNIGIGTTNPQSALHVPDGKYAQFADNNAGAPPAGDCDNDAERGRLSIDTSNNRLYVCNGATRGWDYTALTD